MIYYRYYSAGSLDLDVKSAKTISVPSLYASLSSHFFPVPYHIAQAEAEAEYELILLTMPPIVITLWMCVIISARGSSTYCRGLLSVTWQVYRI